MIIGIDASKAAESKRTGVEEVVYRLCLNLPQIDKKNSYVFYSRTKLPSELIKYQNVKTKVMPFPVLWNRLRLPFELLRYKPDVFLEPGYCLPWFAPNKSVVVIHDLAYKYFPDAYSKWERIAQERAARIAAKHAAKIIFVSESSKIDFLKFYHYKPVNTAVVHLAFDKDNFIPSVHQTNSLKFDGQYILYVGRLEERKNVARIIEAYNQFRQNSNLALKLVLVGQDGFGCEKIKQAITGNPFSEDIITPGYIENSAMPALYSNASIFIFPSLYEGFGIPILEAFACGVPVITAKTSSMPEVANGAAKIVDPQNTKEIADAIYELTSNRQVRIDCINAGLRCAKQFSWQKTAEKVLEVLESL